ncbi:ABC transporter ATP-binding protein [Pseudactinotalea suaedae]|uniref:ABC transporter ATP-binding protein n=1 Tax=Pseudactinotalea suaedae TaxID=1524924 RepID=UPI0012E117B9|nr:ABC transporter ATP-binding protein [Pseudactinotalea suaedae]
MSPILSIEQLAITLRGDLRVVDDVSLEVPEGEIVGIAGESGSGKSMTASALLGLLPDRSVTAGQAWWRGGREPVDLLTLDQRSWNRVRGREIAMVFQDATASLHPMLTVGTQITEHMRVHLKMSRRAARARAIELLDRVRIPDPEGALRSYPHQFSGGMRQRVAIAAALACEPRLLVADEPTTALDVTVQAGILRLLEELRIESGLSVLFITHDLAVLAALTTHAYVFREGRVIESGPTEALLFHPEHDYTKTLVAARPQADDWDDPEPVAGATA